MSHRDSLTVDGFQINEKDFESKSFLGEGQFAEVYKGTKRDTNEDVAMKVYKNEPYDKSEIEILMNISNENIVRVFAADIMKQGAAKDKFVMVTEYCCHGSLDTFLGQDGNQYGLDDENFLRLMENIKNAYEYIRERNIVHRDIKPANILVSEGENKTLCFKLADFGTARIFKYGDSWNVSDYAVGAPLYWHPLVNQRAPEVINNADAATTTSDKTYIDMWSIGTTFFEAATGTRAIQPFYIKTRKNLINTLKEVYDQMGNGVISIKEIAKGRWQKSTKLPHEIKMSRSLAHFVTPLIALFMRKSNHRPVEFILEYLEYVVKIHKYRLELAEIIQMPELLSSKIYKLTKKIQEMESILKNLNQQSHLDSCGDTSMIQVVEKHGRPTISSFDTAVSFILPPSETMRRTLELCKLHEMSPIICDKYGKYVTIDWTNLRGDFDWKRQWEATKQKLNSRWIFFPPLMLPLEYAECLLEMLIEWNPGVLRLRGRIPDNLEMWMRAPKEITIDMKVCVMINDEEIKTKHDMFKFVKSEWSTLFVICYSTDITWRLPIVNVQLFPLPKKSRNSSA